MKKYYISLAAVGALLGSAALYAVTITGNIVNQSTSATIVTQDKGGPSSVTHGESGPINVTVEGEETTILKYTDKDDDTRGCNFYFQQLNGDVRISKQQFGPKVICGAKQGLYDTATLSVKITS